MSSPNLTALTQQVWLPTCAFATKAKCWILAPTASWTFSKAKTKDWEKPSFAATEWKSAAELGTASMAPWNAGKSLASTLSMAGEHQQVRSSLVPSDPLMLALGRPSREQVLTTRLQTATTLQAIELTNGDTLSKLLQRGADKVLADKMKSTDELVTRLYTRALSRKPTRAELASAKDYLGQSVSREGVEDLLWAMAMLPEFQLIY